MLMQPLVGIQNNQDGQVPAGVRGGKQGDLIVSELHGRYYESAYRSNRFSVASQAVATTTVGLATTYTGLALVNPVKSNRNLVLGKCTLMQSVIQATQVEAFAIAFGFNGSTDVTLTTPATPQSRIIGSGAVAQAKAATSATLPTAPVYDTFITNTAAATQNAPGAFLDFEGAVILPPGGYACWVTPGQASVAGMWFSFEWEEVPL